GAARPRLPRPGGRNLAGPAGPGLPDQPGRPSPGRPGTDPGGAARRSRRPFPSRLRRGGRAIAGTAAGRFLRPGGLRAPTPAVNVAVLPGVDLFGDAFLVDPYPLYGELHRRCPVCFVPELGMWLVSRYEDVRSALLDPAAF